MIIRYSLFWFVLMVVAILNGIMRQSMVVVLAQFSFYSVNRLSFS